jgi:HAD superfamily hydrolase (TIGR01490 family)
MTQQRLVLFDLDNTLLTGDSDVEWLQFLIEEGIADRAREEAANADMAARYRSGDVGSLEFVNFYLRTLVGHTMEQLLVWREKYVATRIVPRIPAASRQLLAKHRNDLTVIITATNRFFTEPIAAELGIAHLIATEPEMREGRFTGQCAGIPCFREGKIDRLAEWLVARGERFEDFSQTWFYSDSINDRFLLEKVDVPVMVDPDPALEKLGKERGWRLLKLDRMRLA